MWVCMLLTDHTYSGIDFAANMQSTLDFQGFAKYLIDKVNREYTE
jgi:hypothetical protein